MYSYGMISEQKVLTKYTVPNNSYVYLGYPNTVSGIVNGPSSSYWNLTTLKPKLENANLIYDNKYVQIYYFGV